MRVFVEFNENNICTRVVRVNDPGMVIEEGLEEITDPHMKRTIQVLQHKKVHNQIVKMTQEEITKNHPMNRFHTKPSGQKVI